MSRLDELLATHRTTTGEHWRPRRLRAIDAADRRALEELLSAPEAPAVFDTIVDQVATLIEARDPSWRPRPDERAAAIADAMGGLSPAEYGTWVYYPWKRALVHLLPGPEFRELRASSNRHKIGALEQERLRSLRLGVAGLSVGRATAVTLALEQIGSHYRLADFDRLDLPNLNRVRGGVDELGINKAVLTAREIAEIDPYVEVEVFETGVTEGNLDAFLDGGRPLDILFEECDGLDMKVRLRERARELGIPVVMETSDRGMLDVERFDLEPRRPLFHGLVGEIRADDLRGLSTYQKVPTVLRILDGTRMSKRLAASLMDVDTVLKSFPQLASAVALGGALNAEVARSIALGKTTRSGRVYVDLEAELDEIAEPQPRPSAIDWTAPPPVPPPRLPPPTAGLAEQIRALVAFATLAPSGGNCQPWRFIARGSTISLSLDRERSTTVLDFEGRASRLACGAAAVNLELAANRMGFTVERILLPDGPHADQLVRFDLHGPRAPDPTVEAFDSIAMRCTNRRLGEPSPLSPSERQALSGTAAGHGARLVLLEDEPQRRAAGELLAAVDRVRFLDADLHEEMLSEIRWTPESAVRAGDGIDAASLELDPTQRVAIELMRDASIMAELRRVGGGQGLGRSSRKAAAAASAVALLVVDERGGPAAEQFLRGGMALQHVWLCATRLGLAVQPMAPAVFLFARLEANATEGLGAWTVDALQRDHGTYRRLFGLEPHDLPILLFRIARAEPPTSRSLRRPIEDVLQLA